MDMKEDMMSEAVDDVMDQEEDEEEEGDKILKEVLDEIGVSLSQQVSISNCVHKLFAHKCPVDGRTHRYCKLVITTHKPTTCGLGRRFRTTCSKVW